jgi:hypothetical protein
MRRLSLLVVMTAMVFAAAGSAKGNTSLGQIRLDRASVMVSGQSSLPITKSGKSLIGTILPAPQDFTIAQLFGAATAEDGNGDNEKKPRPRSAHCPPDKDDHHDKIQKSGDEKDKDKDKDKNHDNCGKGDDDKNP